MSPPVASIIRGRPLAIRRDVWRKGPLPGALHLCGEEMMMMMYETAVPLEAKEDMTDRIIWEENTVFVMETDGLCLSSWHCQGWG